jgi:hypothetical protein
MAYKLSFTDAARNEIERIPPDMMPALRRGLMALGDDPLKQSRRAVSPPYPPGGMMAEFDDYQPGRGMDVFVVLFHFCEDEETLMVTGVGYRRYDPRQ